MPEPNGFGQPVGRSLGDWTPPSPPDPIGLGGRYVRLEPLDLSHVDDLHASLSEAPESLWTYMAFGPFSSRQDLAETIQTLITSPGWLPYAIVVEDKATGFASYLRIDPPAGVLEIGSIVFSPGLQRTREATEALFLMIEHAFAIGYRRCEWKCDDLNETSRRAAIRLGFTYEGTFRNATHYKGRNRDTAWYAIVTEDWPEIRSSFEKWLDPANFSESGAQIAALSELRAGDPDG